MTAAVTVTIAMITGFIGIMMIVIIIIITVSVRMIGCMKEE